MQNLRDEMEVLLTERERRLKSVNMALDRCPEGRLLYTKINGKPGYFNVSAKDGKRVTKVITKNKEMLEALIRKELLSNEQLVIENEQNFLKGCMSGIPENNASKVLRDMLGKYPEMTTETLLGIFQSRLQDTEWDTVSFEQSVRYPEKKTQITSRGLQVRSKSEVIIAEALYEAGVPFHYEELLYIGDTAYAPDFTIRRADGKIFYWEHQGLMSDMLYYDRFLNKMRVYSTAGIVPWDNLILTYDSLDGHIDIREVRMQIERKLLV